MVESPCSPRDSQESSLALQSESINSLVLSLLYGGTLTHIHAWLHDKSLQSCPTLCDLMECSLPGTPVHGILQARILKWMAMPSSRGSSQPRDRTCISYVSCIGRWVLYHQCHLGSPHTSLCFPKSIHLKIWQTWTKQLAVWVVKLKVLQKQFPITSYKPDGPNIQFYVYPLCFMEMWL